MLTIRDGTMHDRLVAVPAAADVNDVRTLPLADGRVVLVAGDVGAVPPAVTGRGSRVGFQPCAATSAR